MIISRAFAKARIAREERPSWLAAWGLVLADAAVLVSLLALMWGPVMRMIYMAQPSMLVTFLVLFFLFFVPSQAVLILSSLWAAKSRWRDDDAAKGA